ncbi:DNA excision repair protein ERCC-6-like [Neolamprologus brichardi]|uniref:DNA excision repair protein ERCC-6-like n=1 Tax=Neolamprologus brichardi TaxID=32507 RepID=UPI001643CC26|nr:DNA excision repair protein ERCC-6-like [Neolamprologus brichardi]
MDGANGTGEVWQISEKLEKSLSIDTEDERRGGVIITTYTMLLNNWQQLSTYNGREFTWDYMILDEAHKIKSTTTKTAKSAYAIPSKNRVLLTGTPVQNNLREMWALFDFACQGTLLGMAKTFKAEYENPITRAREKDATPGEKALGSRMSENLMAIIKPYFLRRTKSEVQKNKTNSTRNKEHLEDHVPNLEADSGAVMPKLTRKNDLIVWTYLSAVQEDIYRQFISLDHIRELLLTTRSPLAELNILKKLCDHPRLLSAAAIAKLGLEESAAECQESTEANDHSIISVPDHTLISESGKMVFLFSLLDRLRQEGHRTLVFAHYRKVLDIIERILGNRGFKVLRLDGTITQITERERLISLFQTDRRYSVFLLTTQVGGVGITLTAADRVVIYDPSWNPATDAQAVDRAYRIGQTENVVIYRLITCGTVEEKIYRRQVFKDSLIRQNTGDKKNPFRYFSKQELKELFTLEDTQSSSTQLQLQALHARHRRTDPELDKHIAHLHTMEMFGISDHDLMFTLDINHDEALENQEEHHYIEGRVQKAQELMKAESELQMQLAESMVSSTEPAWLRYPAGDSSRERSREKKPRPSYPKQDTSLAWPPAVVDLEQTGKEATLENLSKGVIDLTAEESTAEEQIAEVSAVVQEEEELQEELLSQLQLEGSFDVGKSLCEWQQKEASRHSASNGHAVRLNESHDSVVGIRKKKAAVIYDSEEETQEEEDGQLENSFQVSGASTPKSACTGTTPLRTRKSIGGNTSVASHRSFLQSIIEDTDNQDSHEDDGDASDVHSDEAEEDMIGSAPDEVEEEEPSGETVNSEEEVEEEEMEEEFEEEGDTEECGEGSLLEETSTEPELASNEAMDQCTAETGVKEVEDESYDSLVRRGRECYSKAELDEALDFFLRAIDIKPGDPEIQLMTIQLYRQLSQVARRS